MGEDILKAIGRGIPLERRRVLPAIGAACASALMWAPGRAYATSTLVHSHMTGTLWTCGGISDGGIAWNGAGVGRVMYVVIVNDSIDLTYLWEFDVLDGDELALGVGYHLIGEFMTELYSGMRYDFYYVSLDYDHLKYTKSNPTPLWLDDPVDDVFMRLMYKESAGGAWAETPRVAFDVIDYNYNGADNWNYSAGWPSPQYVAGPKVSFRRGAAAITRWFGMHVSVFNLYPYDYNNEADDRNQWHECYLDASPTSMVFKQIEISNDRSLLGRIFRLRPPSGPCALSPSADPMCTGNPLTLAAPDDTNHTLFIVGESNSAPLGSYPSDNSALFSAQALSDSPYALDMCENPMPADASTGSWANFAACCLYPFHGDSNQRFWISENQPGYHYLYVDKTGHNLNRKGADLEAGAEIALYASGSCDESNDPGGSAWVLEEAVFALADGGELALSSESGKAFLSPQDLSYVTDAATACAPRAASGCEGDIEYRYDWYTCPEDAQWQSDFAIVHGRVYLTGTGRLLEQAAGEFLGRREANGALESVSLTLEHTAFSGSIRYSTRASGDTSWASARDGAACGAEGSGSALRGLMVWLDGDIAQEYSVEYQVATSGSWCEPVRDGDVAQTGSDIHGIRVRLVRCKTTTGWALAGSTSEPQFAYPEGTPRGHAMCVASARSSYKWVGYRGEVATGTMPIRPKGNTVTYVVDGEVWGEPDEVALEDAYTAPDPDVRALRSGCDGADGWYEDAGYTVPWERDGQLLEADLVLYARNHLHVDYAPTEATDALISAGRLFFDDALESPVDAASVSSALPPRAEGIWYMQTYDVSADLGLADPLYTAFVGVGHRVEPDGVWESAKATGTRLSTLVLAASRTVYIDWSSTGIFDGARTYE